jgi:DNA-binding transcriptional ArsR family regulator
MLKVEERVFAALADPTRRQILTTLAENSPKTATQLAEEYQKHRRISRQGILKHLDLLAEAGLVRVQPVGREKRYSFTPEPLKDVSAWIQSIGAKWDERLLRLKDLVENDADI